MTQKEFKMMLINDRVELLVKGEDRGKIANVIVFHRHNGVVMVKAENGNKFTGGQNKDGSNHTYKWISYQKLKFLSH